MHPRILLCTSAHIVCQGPASTYDLSCFAGLLPTPVVGLCVAHCLGSCVWGACGLSALNHGKCVAQHSACPVSCCYSLGQIGSRLLQVPALLMVVLLLALNTATLIPACHSCLLSFGVDGWVSKQASSMRSPGVLHMSIWYQELAHEHMVSRACT